MQLHQVLIMNFSGNPSGVNPETGGSIFDDPATYITSIGFI